jgi:hypothetical protein
MVIMVIVDYLVIYPVTIFHLLNKMCFLPHLTEGKPAGINIDRLHYHYFSIGLNLSIP